MRTMICHCEYCGDDVTPQERYGRDPVTCGRRECERWAREAIDGEREEAHRQLDEDMGWR